MSPAPDPLPDTDRHRVALIVLGMHRSGTSALTWLLGQMGAALPRDPMEAAAENAKGYWESVGLVAADDRLLRAARSSWFDPRALELSRVPAPLLAERLGAIRAALAAGWGQASLMAIKDPRLCRFVDCFADLLREAGIAPRAVLMLRPAAEVAASLFRRDGTTSAYSHLLWLRHMLDAERDSRALPRAVVSYDQLLSGWRDVAARIAPLMGKEGWEAEDGGATIDEFLDPALRHDSEIGGPPLPSELADLIATAERAFAALLEGDGPDERERLDGVRDRLQAMPWLEGDVIHDELRHRRVPAAPDAVAAPGTEEAPVPEPSRPPSPDPLPDPAGDAALIRGSGLFDAAWYLDRYPDAGESGLDPVDHYLRVGAARGYRPNPLFDTGYYARQMARRRDGAARA